MSVATQTAGTLATASSNAGQMELANQQAASAGQPAPETSATDVWKHTAGGLREQFSSVSSAVLNRTPIGAVVGTVQGLAGPWAHTSVSNIPAAIGQQASAVGQAASEIGKAKGALATVGAVFATLTAVEQMLSMALSAIPFPAFPAVRVLDMDIGLPHAHMHPPNLIPPAPPVPLPSTGPVIPIPFLSGATKTLINSMPAARCGDMGLGIWCGGFFPMYEIFLGSSSVWIEGNRAARVAIDITKHCIFTSPKPQDPPVGPMIGFTITSSANVLIGGIPMPSLMNLAMAGMFKVLFKGLGKALGALNRLRKFAASKLKPGFLRCKVMRAEPVNLMTGEVVVQQQDFLIPGRIPMEWTRLYGSHSDYQGACGFGWQTPADVRLELDALGAVLFYDGTQGASVFESLPVNAPVIEPLDGAVLDSNATSLVVRTKSGLSYEFPKFRTGENIVWVDCIRDRCQNFLQFVRDFNGLAEIRESAGRRIEVMSRDGRIYEMRLRHPEAREPQLLVRYDYNDVGDMVAVHDALNQPYRFEYQQHRLVRHTDRKGLSFYYDFDRNRTDWRVLHAWGDGGLYDYHFEYDDLLNERRITDSLGHLSVVTLNEYGLPIIEVDPLDGQTMFEYDEVGRTTAVVDPAGRRTEYEYDDCGNLLVLTRPDGATIATEFNDDNKPIKIKDPNGAFWEQAWNGCGLLVEQKSPLGAISRYEYDDLGQLSTSVNPRGARTQLGFDRLGNLTVLTDALGHRTQFIYDFVGNVLSKSDPLGRRTEYRYDLKSRLVEVILPSRSTIRCGYDAEDNLTRYVDENEAETRLEYFGLGEIATRYQPDGNQVRYHYDTEERLIGVTNQRGETYRLVRDALGRIVEEIDYWGQPRRYTYDDGGSLLSATDPLGRRIDYTTDPLGRILQKLLPNGVQEQFVYDPNGNLIQTGNAHGTIKRKFDLEDRLLQEAQGDAFTLKNTYDVTGNRIERKSSLGNTIAYDYDLLDQAVAVRINDAEPIFIDRDGAGQIRHESLAPGLNRRFRYNEDGLLTEQEVIRAETPLFSTQYEYDRAGNLTQRHDSQYGTDSFRYDPLGRILEHVDPRDQLTRYLNDPAGDRLVTRVNTANESVDFRIAGDGDTDWRREGDFQGTYYRFDRAGNLVARRDSARNLELEWDANQRLVESRTNGLITRYGYDPVGRRLFKETGGNRTQYFCDGDALLGEVNINISQPKPNNDEREYAYYPETFKPLCLLVSDSHNRNAFHYHIDPNGCPIRLTNDTGQIVWGASYTAWAQLEQQHCATITNPIRLQGQYEDHETGLYYNRNRYFDTNIGAFVTADPLGIVAGENRYRLAPNVWTWADPLGLSCGPNKGAKRGPKTDPTAPHNAKIREVAASIKPPDKVIAGGGVAPERLIATPGGHKAGRRPDVLVERPDGSLYAVNVGKSTASGQPISREVKALQDLNQTAGIPTTFVPYDR